MNIKKLKETGKDKQLIVIAGIGAHAQQTILPDLDQPLRCRMQADHQRLLQILQLMRDRNARHQRNVGGANPAVGKIDRGWCLRRAGDSDQDDVGLFQAFDMLAVIMDHRVVQRVDALEIFGVQRVLRADPAGRRSTEIGLK